MNLTFIGHQSWLISEGDTNILLDPILSDRFGHNTMHGIEIYPPRKINLEKMPKIDAIILSHEHSDHFHIPTLLAFKDATIFYGKLMPDCVTKLLHKAKLKTKELNFQEPLCIGSLEITLYPPDAQTVLWESRVTQVHVQSLKYVNASAFIAVDALVSSIYREDINQGIISLPAAIFVSNNSQIPPKGVAGTLDDFKTHLLQKCKGILGLKILHEILIGYLQGLEEINDIVICGGGFTKMYDTFFGPYQFSNQNEFAAIAQELSTGKNIYGPLPGDIINIEKKVSMKKRANWIHLDTVRYNELKALGNNSSQNTQLVPIKPLLGEFDNYDQFLKAKEKTEDELASLALAIMMSPLGELAINSHSLEKKAFSNYRLLVRFLTNDSNTTLTYCLDFNKAAFILNNNIEDTAIPFGIELYLIDFVAMLNGEIQIWDLAGIAMRSWYLGKHTESPIAFLYSWYGEQIQAENNYKCYLNRWSNMFPHNSK